MDAFASKALSSLSIQDVFVELSDLSPDATTFENSLAAIYSRFDASTGMPRDDTPANVASTLTLEFMLGTRPWQAKFYATDSLYKAHMSFTPYTVLIVMTLLTVCVTIGAYQRRLPLTPLFWICC